VLGGRGARATIGGQGADSVADAVHALTLDCENVGDDLLVSARLREW
jgi:diaminohydroxyphosphoribosylaminopyrimidine deaminase / 5-amino-6-(5-phosphoribosylamino)uracil reductase